MSNIPFIDLQAQFHHLEADIRAGIDGVLAHGRFIMGPEVAELETALADYAGVKHAITCSSGTDALLMPLMAGDIGPGDAIFTTPFTFIATAEIIAMLGATPVFVDIDPKTFNIDPGKLEVAVQRVENEGTLKPRGIIPVDLFGLPADYDTINAIAKAHGLFVLEDAAQGFGGTYKGRCAGSLADVAATSFFPAKPLGCYGDGGAILTDDGEMAEKLRSIRVHGKGGDKYDNVRIGMNGRLDTLQAAILLPKLKAYPEELAARQRIAERYNEGLSDLVQIPHIPAGYSSAWAQYSILVEGRDALQARLKIANVPSMVYYPKPLHLQGTFRHLGHGEGDFQLSESVSERILSLPMGPYLETTDQNHIIDSVKSGLAS